MKTYYIIVSYEEQGVVAIEADSAEHAEELVYTHMENEGLEGLDFNCKNREYLTNGEA
jgi:hypothetical protein